MQSEVVIAAHKKKKNILISELNIPKLEKLPLFFAFGN